MTKSEANPFCSTKYLKTASADGLRHMLPASLLPNQFPIINPKPDITNNNFQVSCTICLQLRAQEVFSSYNSYSQAAACGTLNQKSDIPERLKQAMSNRRRSLSELIT
jgi:hypothetical protein